MSPRAKTTETAPTAGKRDWMAMFSKMEGAVNDRSDPWENPIRSISPAMNQIFGHTHGLPRGYSMLLWGKPKAGKSVISYNFAAGVHRASPDGIVLKFDTEMRDEGQLTPEMAAAYGIDLRRWKVFSTNNPSAVFDQIRDVVGPMVDAGAPVDLIIIDSITGIQGMRAAKQEADGEKKAMQTFNQGDVAQTTKQGLKTILGTQRAPGRRKISLIVTAHAAVEMDMWEQKRGNKEKAAVAFGVQHHCEFWVNVWRDDTKEGKKNALGQEMVDHSRKDAKGDGELVGHKINVWMQGSTMSPEGRMGRLTFDNRRGLVDTNAEVFQIATNWGIIQRAGAHYKFGETTWNGREAALKALEDVGLQNQVVAALLEREKTPGAMVAAAPEDELAKLFDRDEE